MSIETQVNMFGRSEEVVLGNGVKVVARSLDVKMSSDELIRALGGREAVVKACQEKEAFLVQADQNNMYVFFDEDLAFVATYCPGSGWNFARFRVFGGSIWEKDPFYLFVSVYD